MSQPLISIITVVRNAPDDLLKTIESIRKQTFQDFEYIIIDGKSTDSTINVIHQNSDIISKLTSEPDKGIYDAMNKGIKQASAKYLCFLNAGDLFCNEDTLMSVSKEMDRSFNIVYGDMILINAKDDRKKYHKAKDFTKQKLLEKGTAVVCHQSVFALREKTPLFNPKYTIKAELNWYFDLLKDKEFKYKYIQVPIVYYDANGMAFQHFWKNNIQQIVVVVRQHGLIPLFKYNYPKMIALKYRWWKSQK